MGEQVEPLSLKVLRISGYLMIRSSYLNILFTVLSPLDFWVFTPKKFIKNHFWYGWTGRAFISKGSHNFRIFDDKVELLKHFIYRALNPGFLRIYPPKIKINKKLIKIINDARMVGRGGIMKKNLVSLSDNWSLFAWNLYASSLYA